tara:strand:+ start:16866 stop:17177 length:312 start_codon:yes stop_codon:yes gene_type:complete
MSITGFIPIFFITFTSHEYNYIDELLKIVMEDHSIPEDMDKESVIDACIYVNDCFQLKDSFAIKNDFGMTLTGLLKGISYVIKEHDEKLHRNILESLSILANK